MRSHAMPVAVAAAAVAIVLLLMPVAAGASAGAIFTTADPSSATLGTTSPTLTDKATLSGLAPNPSATITFTLTAPGNAIVDTETVPAPSNGDYFTPAGFALPTSGTVTGTWTWQASYITNLFTLPSLAELVVISPASPSLTTTAGGTIILGSGARLTDSGVLSGGYFETGTLTFTLRDPANSVVDTETVSVTGNGTYSTPVGYLPLIAGTYAWSASYSGDGNNDQAPDQGGADELQAVRAASAPAPGTLALLGIGLFALGLSYRGQER